MRMRWAISPLGAGIAAILLSACRSSDDSAIPIANRTEVVEDSAFARRANVNDGHSQIGSVSRRENGDLVLFVDGETVVRFDAAGNQLASATRSGSGPGEWRYVLWAGADSVGIGVLDASNLRLVTLSPDLSPRGEIQVPPVALGGVVAGRLSDGSFVSLLDPPTIPGTGSQRFLTNVIRWTPGRDDVDTVTALPGTDVFIDPEEQTFVRVPGGRVDWAAARDSIIVAGNGHDDSVFVRVGNASGKWIRLQLPFKDKSFNRSDAEAFIEAEVAQVPQLEDQRRLRRTFDKISSPAKAPRYQRLVLDDRGRIWCAVETNANVRVWNVFSLSGELQTQVRLPARARPWLIDEGTIIATLSNDDGFQRLVRYKLQFDMPTP